MFIYFIIIILTYIRDFLYDSNNELLFKYDNFVVKIMNKLLFKLINVQTLIPTI